MLIAGKIVKMLKIFISLFFLACLASNTNFCGTTEEKKQTPNKNVNSQVEKAQITDCNAPEYSNPEWWKEFLAETNYRLAKPEDFKFPEAAINKENLDDNFLVKCPLVARDINGDSDDRDLIALVADKNSQAKDKFSLVVFPTDKKNSKAEGKAFFVIQNKDLSNFKLSISRLGISVGRYNSDGNVDYFTIKWNKKKKQFFLTPDLEF